MYIKRHIDGYLQDWKNSGNLKPLLLRGARQVGKSSSVRELGKTFDGFLEINFEKKEHQDAKKIFERHSSPKLIIDELYAMFGAPIVPNKTLLFLDEVQNCICKKYAVQRAGATILLAARTTGWSGGD
jgi:predicted AAA+ superfamily ATPase